MKRGYINMEKVNQNSPLLKQCLPNIIKGPNIFEEVSESFIRSLYSYEKTTKAKTIISHGGKI